MFQFKRFQIEDLARLALHTGAILGWATGLGKTIAMFIWPLLKVGFLRDRPLRPAKPVLLVVPGDGHDQTDDESEKHFKTKARRLDSQETFLRLSRPDPRTGRRRLDPHYYLTSYTQLTGNGVAAPPKLDRARPERTMAQLNLRESDVIDWFNERGSLYDRHYARLEVTPETPWATIHKQWEQACRLARTDGMLQMLNEAYYLLKKITPLTGRVNSYDRLADDQKQFLRTELVIQQHREFMASLGRVRNINSKGAPHFVKCVYSPTLADLAEDCFEAIVVDEGVKIKGEDTIIGTGTRQIRAKHRLIMSATPIKNRLPDVFHLASYVCDAVEGPSPRFPYGADDREAFAEEFMVSLRNLSKEDEGKGSRRQITPQVCNVHRVWKLFAPIILRRRKEDTGESIVPKRRHVVRVPMGLYQAATYQFHLQARYLDYRDRKAIGPQLTALRIAAANPASELLRRPDNDVTPGNPRSNHSYIPKVASALAIVQQILERGEQGILFGAFQSSLDVFSARLHEAGVPHLVLDGRVSQRKRGQLAREFKLGPPRALAAGLTRQVSKYPIMLAGADCMAELHSFHLCNNAVLSSYSWALDKFIQAINRIHRMNSPWAVDAWSLICEGSIDRRLEAQLYEKGDASDLVLDGHLLGEHTEEANLADLLNMAFEDFKSVKTIDERDLLEGWPRLRLSLGRAFQNWGRCLDVSTLDLPLWRRRSLLR